MAAYGLFTATLTLSVRRFQTCTVRHPVQQLVPVQHGNAIIHRLDAVFLVSLCVFDPRHRTGRVRGGAVPRSRRMRSDTLFIALAPVCILAHLGLW